MQRYFLHLSYHGKPYYGWQRQHGLLTVQGQLEEALKRIGYPCQVTGSSRTDRGVHAVGQIAHITLETSLASPNRVAYSLRSVLPPTLTVNHIIPVALDTHARYHATARTYLYTLTQWRDPLHYDTSYFYPYPLDVQAMQQATSYMVGEHNFKSFCKAQSPVPHHRCCVQLAEWKQERNLHRFRVRANRFLHSMVRTMVGTLLEVGEGKLAPDAIYDILHAKNRNSAGKNVPPQGLVLQEVHYPLELYTPNEESHYEQGNA